MKELAISVTHAARSFADCVNRVRYQGTSYVLQKNGVPVARLVPIASTGDDFEHSAVALREAREKAELDINAAERVIANPDQPASTEQPQNPPRRPALNW